MLRTRVLTAIGLAAVVLLAIFGLASLASALVFALFWLIGAGEWARIAGLGRVGGIAYGFAFGVLVAAVLAFGISPALGSAVLWLALAVWLVTFVLVLRYPQPLARAPILAMGLIVLFAAWLGYYRLHGVVDNGPALILAGLCIVWSADIGAFFVGRGLGRTPLAPRVSPKKTWEGVAGGLALAALTGGIAAVWLDLPLALMLPAAAAMALVSVVGDLGISMLKRRAGLKDSGMLLPGHGGILDRFDGVTAALPFYALALQFAHVLD